MSRNRQTLLRIYRKNHTTLSPALAAAYRIPWPGDQARRVFLLAAGRSESPPATQPQGATERARRLPQAASCGFKPQRAR